MAEPPGKNRAGVGTRLSHGKSPSSDVVAQSLHQTRTSRVVTWLSPSAPPSASWSVPPRTSTPRPPSTIPSPAPRRCAPNTPRPLHFHTGILSKETALNPETDARRQARAGFVDGTRICAFHARIISPRRTAAYRVASRLSEPRVRAEQARRVTPPEADHFNPSSHLPTAPPVRPQPQEGGVPAPQARGGPAPHDRPREVNAAHGGCFSRLGLSPERRRERGGASLIWPCVFFPSE